MRFAKYQVWKIEKPMLTTLIRAEAAWAFIKSFLISIYFGREISLIVDSNYDIVLKMLQNEKYKSYNP